MTDARRPVARAAVALLAIICGLLGAPTASAEGGAAPPTARLDDASLAEVRQLAVDSAASRGWSIVSIGPDDAVFEQALETPVPGLDRPANALVRVRAEFLADGDDIVVQVQAAQIDAPGTPAEHATDVTERYRDNLMNALRSLQGRWASRLTVADPPPPAMPAPTSDRPRVGTWAYYAERYAETQGCRLDDEGAELLNAGADTEVHRVRCRDGATLLVRCHLGECTAAR